MHNIVHNTSQNSSDYFSRLTSRQSSTVSGSDIPRSTGLDETEYVAEVELVFWRVCHRLYVAAVLMTPEGLSALLSLG